VLKQVRLVAESEDEERELARFSEADRERYELSYLGGNLDRETVRGDRRMIEMAFGWVERDHIRKKRMRPLSMWRAAKKGLRVGWTMYRACRFVDGGGEWRRLFSVAHSTLLALRSRPGRATALRESAAELIESWREDVMAAEFSGGRHEPRRDLRDDVPRCEVELVASEALREIDRARESYMRGMDVLVGNVRAKMVRELREARERPGRVRCELSFVDENDDGSEREHDE